MGSDAHAESNHESIAKDGGIMRRMKEGEDRSFARPRRNVDSKTRPYDEERVPLRAVDASREATDESGDDAVFWDEV
jgi:hypothetical protein